MRLAPTLGTVLVSFPALLVVPQDARAQSLLWSYQGVENVVCIAVTPDLNGDGVGEIAFDSYDAGPSGVDHLFCVSGASSGAGSLVWSARPLGGPSNSGGYGDACVRVGPDLTGDGVPDLLYGAAWGSRTAFALDATNGGTFWKFDSYSQSPPTPPESGWVYAMESLGQDLTGDGYPEIVFCLGGLNYRVYCANGRTGAILWSHYYGGAVVDVHSITDLNGDGKRDVVVALQDAVAGVGALSGANGATLWTKSAGSCQSIVVLPDLNADGMDEVVGACWDSAIHCYSGANGAVLWNGAVGANGMRVALLDDVNGDGKKDVAVGSWDRAARVYNGATGALLWRTLVGTLNGGDVWAIDRIADITGDGINDVCCGSFDTKVYAMNGVTGAILWSYLTGSRVFTVRGGPDLSGNGVPDVLAGTQMLSGVGGICYAIEGGQPSAAVGEAEARAPLLSHGYPNPLRTRVSWELMPTRSGYYQLSLFAPDGRRVAVPFAANLEPGDARSVEWLGRDDLGRTLPAGAYWVRLTIDGARGAEARVTLLR